VDSEFGLWTLEEDFTGKYKTNKTSGTLNIFL